MYEYCEGGLLAGGRGSAADYTVDVGWELWALEVTGDDPCPLTRYVFSMTLLRWAVNALLAVVQLAPQLPFLSGGADANQETN